MSALYRIQDEPTPGNLAKFVVNPIWPLFAIMFGGSWLSWPWFLFNSHAMGSPTRNKELYWIVGGFLGKAGIAILAFRLVESETIANAWMPYVLISLTIWKLGVSYKIFMLQQQSFGIYEYFAGTVRNGVLVLIIGSVFGGALLTVIDPFSASPFLSTLWLLVLR